VTEASGPRPPSDHQVDPVPGHEWRDPVFARAYLDRLDQFPHRDEAERAFLELIPPDARRVLDLGTGDGHLLALARTRCPGAAGVALDASPTMLEAARARFAGDETVRVVEHDLSHPLPELGRFDAIVSSFSIHHLFDERKRVLMREIFELLEPGGVFVHLEHVASPTPELHEAFHVALGTTRADEEDPSDRLVAVETQLGWLRDEGFSQVDCFWKWREMALLAGRRPSD
jgi:tRNA (cmo5U34)-methyltransferase